MSSPSPSSDVNHENEHQTRVLCLHGWLQSKQRFTEKTGGFRKNVRKYGMALEYIDAPIVVDASTLEQHNIRPPTTPTTTNATKQELQPDPYRSWIHTTSKDFSDYQFWKESVKYVLQYMKDNGPFHGLLGFSQGCLIVQLICVLVKWEDIMKEHGSSNPEDLQVLNELHQELTKEDLLPDLSVFQFAIFSGGFLPNDLQLKRITRRVRVPQFNSLHIIGELDQVIEPQRSEELVGLFATSDGDESSGSGSLVHKHVHKGAHLLPHDKGTATAVNEFIRAVKSQQQPSNKQ